MSPDRSARNSSARSASRARRALVIVGLGVTVLGLGPASAQDVKPHAPASVIAPAARRRRIPRPAARAGHAVLVRYEGAGTWSLADAGKIQAFFADRFDRPLPVSAWGQTLVHERLGLDHRNALDVAVHPDSVEGRALVEFLRSEGIPFVAVRARLPGSSTGAHIHIGPESCRLASPRHRARVAGIKGGRGARRGAGALVASR